MMILNNLYTSGVITVSLWTAALHWYVYDLLHLQVSAWQGEPLETESLQMIKVLQGAGIEGHSRDPCNEIKITPSRWKATKATVGCRPCEELGCMMSISSRLVPVGSIDRATAGRFQFLIHEAELVLRQLATLSRAKMMEQDKKWQKKQFSLPYPQPPAMNMTEPNYVI
jgi:hypothetical protein